MQLKFRVLKCPEASSKRFSMPLSKPATVQVESMDGWRLVNSFTNRDGVYFAYEKKDGEWQKLSQKETEELMLYYVEISRALRGHVDKRKEAEEPGAKKHKARSGGRRVKTKGGVGAAALF